MKNSVYHSIFVVNVSRSTVTKRSARARHHDESDKYYLILHVLLCRGLIIVKKKEGDATDTYIKQKKKKETK